MATRLCDKPNPKHEKLNRARDEISRKFVKGTVHLAIDCNEDGR
jgi:hypothetical protein